MNCVFIPCSNYFNEVHFQPIKTFILNNTAPIWLPKTGHALTMSRIYIPLGFMNHSAKISLVYHSVAASATFDLTMKTGQSSEISKYKNWLCKICKICKFRNLILKFWKFRTFNMRGAPRKKKIQAIIQFCYGTLIHRCLVCSYFPQILLWLLLGLYIVLVSRTNSFAYEKFSQGCYFPLFSLSRSGWIPCFFVPSEFLNLC